MPTRFLAIGHICQDIAPAGYVLGGTATYAAVTARALGLHAGIVTRVGSEVEWGETLAGVDVVRRPSPATTTFHNLYAGGDRVQYLRARGQTIEAADIPPAWQSPEIVLLGPIAQELRADLIERFPHSLRGACLQGWMRAWDAEGRVHNQPVLALHQPLEGLQVAILSEEDIAQEPETIQALIQRIPLVALTAGARGATIFWNGQRQAVAPRPARLVDPTGAGDVFAAGFLIRLHETNDPLEAGRFANVTASLSIEGAGISAIPSRAAVLAELARLPNR